MLEYSTSTTENDSDIVAQQEIAEDSEKSREVIRRLFESMQGYAEQHGGSYMEVHKIGESYIPLVALVETDGWGRPDEGLGYVTVDSSHTLAEIYRDHAKLTDIDFPYLSDRVKQTQEALEGLGVLDFVKATGLGTERKTLRYRGKIQRAEDGAYVFNTQKNYTYNREEDPSELKQMVAGLAVLGIKSQISEGSTSIDIGYYDSASVRSVDTEINYMHIPPEKRNSEDDMLGVLVGISSTSSFELKDDVLGRYVEGMQNVTLYWAEGPAKNHSIVYEAAGVEENSALELRIGEDVIRMSARYDELDMQQTVLFLVECTNEQFERHKGSLTKLARRTGEDLQKSGEWSDIGVDLQYSRPDGTIGARLRVL